MKFVISAFFFAIIFQDIWAIVQFLNQSTFNLSVLGETPIESVNLDLIENYTGKSITIFNLKFGKFISGFTGSPYLLARENLLLFPLFFSMYLSGRYISGLLIHFLGLILMVFGLIFGLSKGAWVGAFISIVIILVFEVKYNRIKMKKIFIGILMSISIFIIFGQLIYLRLFETNLSSSFESRVFLNSFGIHMFTEHPIMGVGANNLWLYLENIYKNNTTVHNLYILMLSELGLIGLTLFIFILIYILFKTISINKANSYYYTLSAGLSASFIAFYCDALWTWLYRFNQVGSLFWALGAVSFAAYNISSTGLLTEQ